MSAIAEYVKRGGLAGIARQQILDALQEASGDPDHEFQSVANSLSRSANLKASRSLFKILTRALADASSKYHLSAVLFLKVPAAHFAIEEAWAYLEQHGWQGPTDNETLDDVWARYLEVRRTERAVKLSRGGMIGGATTAAKKRAENEKRDRTIRRLHLPVKELAERFGLTNRRVRQIVNSK